MRAIALVLALTTSACIADSVEPDEPRAERTTVAVRLDRDIVESGIEPVRATALACPNDARATGIVKIKVTVAPDGHVTDATPQPPAAYLERNVAVHAESASLQECVARVVKTATFAKTRDGGSFAYPFAF